MTVDLAGYNTVPERIREFAEKYPDGRLRPLDPERPFWIEEIDGRRFVVYVAAAYRAADDQLPGVGCAWEPMPGTTSFTRNSELQNCETSAWGRAIVATLAADTRKGIATAEDIQNREATPADPAGDPAWPKKQGHALADAAKKAGFTAPNDADQATKDDVDKARRDVLQAVTGKRSSTELTTVEEVQDSLAAYAGIANGDKTLAYTETGEPYLREEPF